MQLERKCALCRKGESCWLGVLIHDKTEGQKMTVIIFVATQASRQRSVLQAAAKALELAAYGLPVFCS